ncbi:MAG: GNAT family N-acetyltransferase [Sphaerochaeta sp.]|nr:GNAT family N-acetyltransferase [Sphaerochaeta sp.]
MSTIRTNTLTPQQRTEILHLRTMCSEYEQLENSLFLSNEMNTDPSLPCFFLRYEQRLLAGVLVAFFPTTAEVEVNALVLPDYRRRGIFSSLVTEARRTYAPHGFLQMLFQVESSSKSGKAYLETRFPHIDRTEYRMRLSKSRWREKKSSIPTNEGTLVEATGEALPQYVRSAALLLREDAACVQRLLSDPARTGYLYLYEGKPIGVLQQYTDSEGLTMLHAVAIDEAYRGRGHGKAMLALALDALFMSCDVLTLEVDSVNPVAFALYCALGFEIEFQVDYHALNLSSL